jgi:putative transposase
MSNRKERQKPKESTSSPSAGGRKKGELKPSGLLEDSAGTTSSLMLPELVGTTEKSLSMPGLAVEPNSPTLTGFSQPSAASTRLPLSLPKSAADSTSNEKSCKPYWNEFCQAMSEWLSLPTKTDWQGKALTCFDGSASKTGVSSWYSMRQVSVGTEKWLRTSSPSSTASDPGSTASESTKLRSKKIRIYPSSELNKTWRKWLAACRYCYNQAIALQRSGKRLSKLKLRNEVMQGDLPQWVKETPCHIRQNAVFDAHLAFSASRDAKFRSCRDSSQSIKFNDSNFSQGTWYPNLTKGLSFAAAEQTPISCAQGTQIVFAKGRWFAIFPEPVQATPTKADGIIALDPGVRTFLTGFDGRKFLGFGNGDIGRITRLCQHLDDLASRIAREPNKNRRRSMRRAAQRMRVKIRNLVDEAHKQIAHYLTRNYRLIFLPTFETSDMVAKVKRKIKSKTARAMLTWAHYRFKQT